MGLLNLQEPTVFYGFDKNVPDWDFFIKHANYARNLGGDHLRILNDYYFVVEVFDDEIQNTIHGYKDFYNQINSNHDDGIIERPVFLISYFNAIGNLGKHKDPTDQFFWNCIGNTIWDVDLEDGRSFRYLLSPGDMIAIPANTPHNVSSATPRAGITFSSNRKADS